MSTQVVEKTDGISVIINQVGQVEISGPLDDGAGPLGTGTPPSVGDLVSQIQGVIFQSSFNDSTLMAQGILVRISGTTGFYLPFGFLQNITVFGNPGALPVTRPVDLWLEDFGRVTLDFPTPQFRQRIGWGVKLTSVVSAGAEHVFDIILNPETSQGVTFV